VILLFLRELVSGKPLNPDPGIRGFLLQKQVPFKSILVNKKELIERNRDLEELIRLYEETNRDLRKLIALKDRQKLIRINRRGQLF
jgi:hypothetical protein